MNVMVTTRCSSSSLREDFDHQITQLDLGKPLTKRLKPRDGWKMVWGAEMKRMYEQQLKDLEDGRGAMKDLNAADRAQMKRIVQQMLKQLDE